MCVALRLCRSVIDDFTRCNIIIPSDTGFITARLLATLLTVTVIFYCLPLRMLGHNLLKPGHVMHQQFNIQQFYVLPTL